MVVVQKREYDIYEGRPRLLKLVNIMKWIVICLTPVLLVLLWNFSFIWGVVHLSLLTLSILILVFALTLWSHVTLSSPHHTSSFLVDAIEKKIRQLDEILKVSKSI